MTGIQYAILAYIVGLGLLAGYALVLWTESRRLAARGRKSRPT